MVGLSRISGLSGLSISLTRNNLSPPPPPTHPPTLSLLFTPFLFPFLFSLPSFSFLFTPLSIPFPFPSHFPVPFLPIFPFPFPIFLFPSSPFPAKVQHKPLLSSPSFLIDPNWKHALVSTIPTLHICALHCTVHLVSTTRIRSYRIRLREGKKKRTNALCPTQNSPSWGGDCVHGSSTIQYNTICTLTANKTTKYHPGPRRRGCVIT